jgi:general stress protein 26
MNAPLSGMALLFALSAPALLRAQAPQPATPSREEVIAAAKDIMQQAKFSTLVTIGRDKQPQARIVEPFPPDADLTIWIGTNSVTRKVDEIRRNKRVTLMFFSPSTFEYVTILGTATIDTDPMHKAAHWNSAWSSLYKDQNRGDDYVLLRVKPVRLELISQQRGMRNDPKTWLPVTLDLQKK